MVDLTTFQISKKIKSSGWTESILRVNDQILALNRTQPISGTQVSNLLFIEPFQETISDSLELPSNPNSMVLDENENLWIMCEGDSNLNSLPALLQVNVHSKTVERNFNFQHFSDFPFDLKVNKARNSLFFISGSAVFKMSTGDSSLPQTPFISIDEALIYSIGIDPQNDEIYISDAIDFVQNGLVSRYSSSGVLIDNFKAGKIPGDFVFIY